MPYFDPNLSKDLIQWQRYKFPILIAEGDSWFNYPSQNDPLEEIDIIAHLNKIWNIIDIAHHGDKTTDMIADTRNQQYAQSVASKGIKVKAVLLSGGGNDIVKDTLRRVTQDPRTGSNVAIDYFLKDDNGDLLLDGELEIVRKNLDLTNFILN
jgi:hypothetical protein